MIKIYNGCIICENFNLLCFTFLTNSSPIFDVLRVNFVCDKDRKDDPFLGQSQAEVRSLRPGPG